MERLTKRISGYAHGAEGERREKYNRFPNSEIEVAEFLKYVQKKR